MMGNDEHQILQAVQYNTKYYNNLQDFVAEKDFVLAGEKAL